MIVEEKDANGHVGERTITEQKTIEWEVKKSYWKLYRKHEDEKDKEEIIRMTKI